MKTTQIYNLVTTLIATQGAAITDETRLDVESALRNLGSYPVEDRTLTLLICLLRGDQARLSLRALQDNAQYRFFS
jgi:hypothetical protein